MPAEFVPYIFLIPLAGIMLRFFKEWLRFKAQQTQLGSNAAWNNTGDRTTLTSDIFQIGLIFHIDNTLDPGSMFIESRSTGAPRTDGIIP